MAKGSKNVAVGDVITRETTIHLHKHILKRSFKTRSPYAVKVVRQYAEKLMGTKDVRVDPKLNKAIWAKGVHGVPTRIRVRFSRQRNDDEDAKHKLYTVATYVPVTSFAGLQTENIDE